MAGYQLLILLLLSPSPLYPQLLAPTPVRAIRTGELQDPDLRESSGVIRSHWLPGILFTINDSGNPPVIFAIDSTGRPIGRWLVPRVRNRDWEAVSIGPCPSGSCLVLADLGDNLEAQPYVTLYRVREPRRLQLFLGAADATPLDLDSALVRYPDAPHDAEAIWIYGDGSVAIVTKGRTGSVLLFRVPPTAFTAGRPVVAQLVQRLPIEPERVLGRWVTDAARSPDGRRVAIRTYNELFLFPLLDRGTLGTPVACNLVGLEPQGEGITWLDNHRLLLTSEAPYGTRAGPVHIVTCQP